LRAIVRLIVAPIADGGADIPIFHGKLGAQTADKSVKVDPKKFAPQEVFAWYAKRMKQAESDRDFGDPVFLPGGALWWLAALGGG